MLVSFDLIIPPGQFESTTFDLANYRPELAYLGDDLWPAGDGEVVLLRLSGSAGGHWRTLGDGRWLTKASTVPFDGHSGYRGIHGRIDTYAVLASRAFSAEPRPSYSERERVISLVCSPRG